MPFTAESTIRYGSLDHAFKYDESKTFDANVSDLLKIYTPNTLSSAQLESVIRQSMEQFSMNSVARTPSERAAALQRSKKAQQLIAESVVATVKLKQDHEIAHPGTSTLLERATIFLSPYDNDKARDFNNRFVTARRENPAEFARLQYQALEEAREEAGITSPDQLAALFDASEQELLEKYPPLNRYLRMLADTQALAKNEALTPAQREELLQYHVGMNLLGVMEARLELMANPFYPEINPDSLYECGVDPGELSHNMENTLSAEELNNRNARLHPLVSLFGSLATFSANYSTSILDRAAFQYPSLKNAVFDAPNPMDALSTDKMTVGHTEDGQDIVVTNSKPLKVQTAQAHMKELYDETVKADKWLLTGSKQFADMQTSLNEYLEAKKNPMDREATSMKAGELAKKATEYLEYKLKDKGLDPPYTAESVKNLGKNKREQSRLDAAVRILSYATKQKQAADNSLRNEKLLKEVSVNINASKQQRDAFARNLDDLIMPDVGTATLKHPISKEDFSVLVMLACGSRQVSGDKADAIYADMVKGSLFEGKAFVKEHTETVITAREMVKEAIKKGDARLLSQLVTEGLQQNNKLLQQQSALDDKFCFLADLGAQAQQIQKKYSGLLENYSLPEKDTQILNAAKAISDLRAKGLECQRNLAFRSGLEMFSATQDLQDLAAVCQMYGANKLLVSQHDLATTPYGQIPDFAGKCNKQLADSKTLSRFNDDNSGIPMLSAVQNAKEITTLYNNFMDEMTKKALEQQQKAQQKQLTMNAVQQQPKEVTIKGSV